MEIETSVLSNKKHEISLEPSANFPCSQFNSETGNLFNDQRKKLRNSRSMVASNKTKNNHQPNYGRWTREEKDKFIQALKTYGNSWKDLRCCIKTRSIVQIRSHLQKYVMEQRKKAIKKAKYNKTGELFAVYKAYANKTYQIKKYECQSEKKSDVLENKVNYGEIGFDDEMKDDHKVHSIFNENEISPEQFFKSNDRYPNYSDISRIRDLDDYDSEALAFELDFKPKDYSEYLALDENFELPKKM